MSTSSNNRSRTILVIEEDSGNQIHINGCFDKHPTTSTIIVDNIPAALAHLDLARRNRSLPDLILIDYQLIGSSEQSIFNAMRDLGIRGSVPVIALHTVDEKSVIAEAYDQGVASYFLKPSEVEEWQIFFEVLIHYWFNQVTLPSLIISRRQ